MAGDKEIPLPTSVVTEKRGRGRPRKPDALTNAERQAAFRARRKAAGKTVTVTQNIAPLAEGYDELVLECERLREELAQARRVVAETSRRPARDGALGALAQRLPDKGDLDDRRLALT